MNRLADAQPPYLLQHPTNSVGWRPWGQEAFAKASSAAGPLRLLGVTGRS
ncbi:DUF255 domain-containing protein [Streptomyces sp. NPDC006984]